MSASTLAHVRILNNPTPLFFAIPLCVLLVATASILRHVSQRRAIRAREASQISAHPRRSWIMDEGNGKDTRRRERCTLFAYVSVLALLGAMLPLFDSRTQTADGARFGAKGELGLRAILGFLLGVPVFYFNTDAAFDYDATVHGGRYSPRRMMYTGALAFLLASATILAIIQAVLLPSGLGTSIPSPTADHVDGSIASIIPPYLPFVLFLVFTLVALPWMTVSIKQTVSNNPQIPTTSASFPSMLFALNKSNGGSSAPGLRAPHVPARSARKGKKASSWRASFCSRPITIHVATHRTSSAEDEEYLGTAYPANPIPVALPLGGMTHCYSSSGSKAAAGVGIRNSFQPPTNSKSTRSLRSTGSVSTIESVGEHEWMSMSKRPSIPAIPIVRVPMARTALTSIPSVVRTGPEDSADTSGTHPEDDEPRATDSGVDFDTGYQEQTFPPGFEGHRQYHPGHIQSLVNSAIQMQHPGQGQEPVSPADQSTSTDNSNSNGTSNSNSFDMYGTEDRPPRERQSQGRDGRLMGYRARPLSEANHLSIVLLITAAQLALACAYACGCALGVQESTTRSRLLQRPGASNALEVVQTVFTVLGAIGCVVACFVHTRSCRTSTSTIDASPSSGRQSRNWGFGLWIPSTPSFMKRRSSEPHNFSATMSAINTAMPSTFPTSAARIPPTPAYAATHSINYGSHFHTPITPIYNHNGDHLYTPILQSTTHPAAVYDPNSTETKSAIAELASPRGRRSRVNAIPPGVVAPIAGLGVPQSCHSNSSWNSTSDGEADASIEASTESSALDHFVQPEEIELSSRSGARRSSQLLRSVSAGKKMTTERRGSIHRSRTTGSKSSVPASPKRFFGWDLGREVGKTLPGKTIGRKGAVDTADDRGASFIDLKVEAAQEQGIKPSLSKKTSSTAPSAFSYGASVPSMGGLNEGVPGAPKKLKKRPKSASESTTGATVNSASHHRLSASTFISTMTNGTGATKASTLPASPISPSASTSYRRYSLGRGFLGHRRIHSVSSGTGTAENRRHSGLSDTSRIALKRSLTNFRRSVGRTLGPGLTLAVASSSARSKDQDCDNGPGPVMDEPIVSPVSGLASPVSDTSTTIPSREASTTPRPARPTVITIQAPTPPASISHPFFDPSLQHKTSSSTFRSKEQETVVEPEDDTFELEREMEDEIQEMRSECGSSSNHRALERFNMTLNSVVPSSSETLYARYRADEEKPWGTCVPQTRNALSSPPAPKSDWIRRGSAASAGGNSTQFPALFSQGLATPPIHSSAPLPSTSTMPDVYQENSQTQSSPSTPRQGSTLRLSSITMGSVRNAFAGVGARMSSATSRMSVNSAAGSSMQHVHRSPAGEATDDDGDFMDLRDPFASPPPASGKVKTHGPSKKNLFKSSGSRFGENFLEVDGDDEELAGHGRETAREAGDRRKMTAWGRLPMPARQTSAATSKRSSYTSTSRNSRATGKTTSGSRKHKKESKERRTRKTSALSASSRPGGGAGARGDTEDVDFGLEEALLSQRLLSRLDAIAWES